MRNNTEIAQGVYAAFRVGDMEAVLAIMDPNIQWVEAEGGPYGGTYVGADAVLKNVFMRLGTEWTGFSAVPREYVAADDAVVVLGEYSGSYNATGKSFKAPFAHVWKFKGGKAVSFEQYTDTAVHLRPTQS